jgi:IS66 C-terminal element
MNQTLWDIQPTTPTNLHPQVENQTGDGPASNRAYRLLHWPATNSSLIQSAKLNGYDPYAYLKDVLKRLPTQRNSMIGELLPHHWQPQC